MDKESEFQNLNRHYDGRVIEEFFNRKLVLNMFGVYDKFGKLMLKPVMNDDFDYIESLEYYNELSKTILFADFYIDDEIGELTLLRNDILGITVALIHKDDESKLEFIGEKTVGELLKKYPGLL